ncbi:MAG: hypothetical protein AAF098_13385 [Pseudomonadota bacterium]
MSLTTGGKEADLPAGWIVPWGYPGTGNKGALWVGATPPSPDEVKALTALEWAYDELTLVGTHNTDWNARQYLGLDRESLADPWSQVKCPGGLGSHTYQFQFMPEGVDACIAPSKWITVNGEMKRSQGGEYVHKVDLGQGSREYHEGGRSGSPAEGKEFYWDAEAKLHRVAPQ